MKRTILLAALAASFNIHADTIEAANTVGGKIVLTDVIGESCPNKQKIAYTTHPDGDVMFGCWAYIDGRVFVKYQGGGTKAYELDGFVVKSETKPVKRGM